MKEPALGDAYAGSMRDERAKATLALIRDGDYNLTRPTAIILPELLEVIALLDKRTRHIHITIGE